MSKNVLCEVLPEPLDLSERRVEVAHALLDVLGVHGGADRRPRAARKRRLGGPRARLGGVLGGVSSRPRGGPSQPELALEAPCLFFACARLGLRRLCRCRRLHRALRHRGLLRLRHIVLGSGQAHEKLRLRARFPPASSWRLAGVTRAKTPRANYQSFLEASTREMATRARIACRDGSPDRDHRRRRTWTSRSLTRSGALETLEPLAAGSVNSNFSVQTAGPGGRRLFLRLYEERDRAGAEPRRRWSSGSRGPGVPDRRALPPDRRGARLGAARQAGRALSSGAGAHPLPARG